MTKPIIEKPKEKDIRVCPQPGPQEMFLASPADIAIYGGAAGGGKTFALLLDPLRYVNIKGFGAVIFRRTVPEIIKEGGLWDEASGLYPLLGAEPNQARLSWKFKTGGKISFSHMQHEKDRFKFQGSQIPYLGWDEATHFTFKQWNYMFSRNRSTCGVPPLQRLTCNPDPKSWLKKFIQWWIDEETGLPVQERSGRLRWFVLVEDEFQWGADPKELKKKFKRDPKSVSFIGANIFDNKILLAKNPEYLANLDALDKVQRARLKDGNWNIDYTAGLLFKREWLEMVDAAPPDTRWVRFWDRAATEAKPGTDPDWTVGLKLGRNSKGIYYIGDVARMRATPGKVQDAIKNIASQDTRACMIGLSQDPGQAGKAEMEILVRHLAGYSIKTMVETKDKITRATPVSSIAEHGFLKLIRAPWNDALIEELVNFPEGAHDDQVDSLSGAFSILTEHYGILPSAGPGYESVQKRREMRGI